MKWSDLHIGDVLWNSEDDPCWLVIRKIGPRIELFSLILNEHHITELDLAKQDTTGRCLGDESMYVGWGWLVTTEGRLT
jgi:hypothetical protein